MATDYWTGQANDIAQIVTSTISGTWASLDVAVAKIDNVTVEVELGAAFTTGDVAEALSAAINAADYSTGLIGTEVRNRGGQELGQFKDVRATFSGSVLTVRSSVPGEDFTIAFSQTTAGSGVMGAATTTQSATGKNWFSNVNNWASGGLPNTGDTIVYTDGSISVLSGLNNTTTQLKIDRRNGYTGNIGRHPVNTTWPGYEYPEYRQQYLDLPGFAGGTQTGVIGERGNTILASGLTKIDYGTVTNTTMTLTIYDSAVATFALGESVVIAGGKGLDLSIYKGSLAMGFDSGTASELSSLLLSYDTDVANDASVRLGEGVTLAASTTITQNGGTLRTYGLGGVANLTYDFFAGLTYMDRGSGTIGLAVAITVYSGAVLNYDGVGATTLYLYGKIDLSQSAGSTFTNATFYKGFNLLDASGNATWTNGIDFVGCIPDEGTFKPKPNQTWTPSAI